MHSEHQTCDVAAARDPDFTTTHWSWVVAAAQKDSPAADEALSRLCAKYWYPLYVYLRLLGHGHEDAQDLVQAFFLQLLQKDYLKNADRKKGRFRTFLLTMLNHFRANEWDRATRQKRGGRIQVIPLSAQDPQGAYLAEPVDEMTPEKAYEVRWATLLLGRVLDRVEREFATAGRTAIFDELKVSLIGEKSERTYAEIAQRYGMSEGSVKVTVHRLRHRYREILREEIAETVDAPGAIEDEIRHLFPALN